MGEFELIQRYFTRAPKRAEVDLGVGDDGALLSATAGMQWVVSSDMLVEGRHFLSTVNPEWLGHKALAVNLSDLAACGAEPTAFTLALALPSANASWLEAFSRGLLRLADEHRIELIGGDTTRGPLNICITVMGQVPRGQALLRSGARAGDDLYVSGNPGEARAALEVFRGTLQLSSQSFEHARARMEQPTPRVALGQALRGLASSAMDVSDGLGGDLQHILKASNVRAHLSLSAIAQDIVAQSPVLQSLPLEQALGFVLAGGDDYELLFTAPPALRDAVQAASAQCGVKVSRMGVISAVKHQAEPKQSSDAPPFEAASRISLAPLDAALPSGPINLETLSRLCSSGHDHFI
jgi:thiamine-monophosphate kinase